MYLKHPSRFEFDIFPIKVPSYVWFEKNHKKTCATEDNDPTTDDLPDMSAWDSYHTTEETTGSVPTKSKEDSSTVQ